MVGSCKATTNFAGCHCLHTYPAFSRLALWILCVVPSLAGACEPQDLETLTSRRLPALQAGTYMPWTRTGCPAWQLWSGARLWAKLFLESHRAANNQAWPETVSVRLFLMLSCTLHQSELQQHFPGLTNLLCMHLQASMANSHVCFTFS